MARVLILIDHYLPGCKYGGTLRTISNLIDRLGSDLDFWIVTSDRDLSDPHAYPDIQVSAWSRTGKAMVYYASPRDLSIANLGPLLTKLCQDMSPDLVFLNGLFGKLTIRCLLLRRLGLLPRIPVLLAPRGQLSDGSLAIKAVKKKLYLGLSLAVGLYQDLAWQAASSIEMQDIRRIIDNNSDVYLAANIPAQMTIKNGHQSAKPKKVPGEVGLVFLSRVSRVKNLLHTLETLRRVSGEVTLDIYGHCDDQSYWRECQDVIAQLPRNIRVEYRGEIKFSEVGDILAQYHFFVLPTRGENFGHAIFEALSQGCPVVISDKTPWRGLAPGRAGWDLPLDNRDLWQEVLQQCVEMDQTEYQILSQFARSFAADWLKSSKADDQSSALFFRILERRRNAAHT